MRKHYLIRLAFWAALLPVVGLILSFWYRPQVFRNLKSTTGLRQQEFSFPWKSIGPSQLGGRTRALVFSRDGNTLYAGAAGGGLWKSTDEGNSWSPIKAYNNKGNETTNSNLAVTSIGIDRQDGTIYVATGELGFKGPSPLDFFTFTSTGYIGQYGQPGQGIFVSTDEGQSFKQAPATWSLQFPQTTFDVSNPWVSVQKVTARDGKALAATIRGLYVSNDKFETATPANGPDSIKTGIIFDIEYGENNTVYVATENGVYISEDGGENFGQNQALNIVPTREIGGSRVEIAVCPSNPKVIAVTGAATTGRCTGVWYSNDGGKTWKEIGPADAGSDFSPFGIRGKYAMSLAIDPDDPERVLLGGSGGTTIRAYKPTTGWVQLAISSEIVPNYRLYVPNFVHTIVYHPNKPNTFFCGTDREIQRTDNNGTTSFVSATQNYTTSEINYIGSAIDGRVLMTTPNARIYRREFSPTTRIWDYIPGGVGLIEGSIFNADHFMYSAIGGSGSTLPIFRTLNGGSARTELGGNSLDTNLIKFRDNLAGATVTQPAAFAFDETILRPDSVITDTNLKKYTQTYLYTGLNRKLWVFYNPFGSIDSLPRYARISSNTSLDITAIAVSGTSDHYVFAGTSDGKIMRVKNAHIPKNIEEKLISTGAGFPNQWISSLTVAPNKPETLVVTFASFNNNAQQDMIYISTNATAETPTFRPLQANLPKMPIYTAAFNPVNPDKWLALGTQYGFWYNNGTLDSPDWKEANTGDLARVPVTKINFRKFERVVDSIGGKSRIRLKMRDHIFMSISTAGLGAFSLAINPQSGEIEPDVLDQCATCNYGPEVGIHKPKKTIDLLLYPNPATEVAYLALDLDSKAEISVQLITANGRLIQQATHHHPAAGRFTAEMHLAHLPAGIYHVKAIVRRNGDDIQETATRPIVVSH
jgi:hypothetical protein